MSVKISAPKFREDLLLSSDDQLQKWINESPWEIAVNNSYWSIVLAWLTPVVHKPEFDYRLEKVCGSLINSDKINECIRSCNPFYNQQGYFSATKLKIAIQTFENKIRRATRNRRRPRRRAAVSIAHDVLIPTVARLLKCRIGLVTIDNDSNLHSLPEFNIIGEQYFNDEILLFCKKTDRYENEITAFALPRKTASIFQENALYKILGKNYDVIGKILSLSDQNLITSLAKNKPEDIEILKRLLNGPIWKMMKLSEAGYCTDPTKSDSTDDARKTAFYYALCSKDSSLLYSLYVYYINSSLWSSDATRKLDNRVADHLEKLSTVLEDAKNVYVEAQGKFHRGFTWITEMSKFHDFYRQVHSGLLSLNSQTSPLSTLISNQEFESKRQKKVLSILKIYLEYFHIENCITGAEETETQKIHYESFVEYQNFYHCLDFHAALFFFDNSYLLKEEMTVEDKTCDEMETSFASFHYWTKHYCKKTYDSGRRVPFDGSSISESNKLPFILMFLERFRFQEAIELFYHHLEVAEVGGPTIQPNFPTLESEPLIKDNIVLLRLKRYINIAAEVNLEEHFEKGVAAIERCIQILGESLKLGKGSPTLAKAFLLSFLPHAVRKDIIYIRNCMSHYKHWEVSRAALVEIEEDMPFFKSLQKDLQAIRTVFLPIFHLHKVRLLNHSLTNGIKKLRDIASSGITDDHSNLSDDNINSFYDMILTCKNEDLQSCLSHLTNLSENVEHEFGRKFRESFSFYNQHFEAHFASIKQKSEDKLKNSQGIRENITKRFYLMKTFLEGIIENAGLNEETRIVLFEKVSKVFRHSETLKSSTLDDLKRLKDDIFRKVQFHVPERPVDQFSDASNFTKIKQFKKILSNNNFLPKRTKSYIQSAVPVKYSMHHTAKKNLITSLEDGNFLSDRELDDEIEKLAPNSQKRARLGYCDRDINEIEKLTDHYDTLETALEKNKIDGGDFKIICEEFGFSDHTKRELGRIVMGKAQPRDEEKIYALEFFNDRVQKLKRILIESNDVIRHIWERSRRSKTTGDLKKKEFLRDTIVNSYLSDLLLKTAVDQLMLDCIGTLKDYDTELSHLWIKTKGLFQDVDLRNVLAHGNPLLTCVGNILDPCDLPKEIIENALKLISHADSITAMCELKKTEYGLNYKRLVKMIETKKPHDFDKQLYRIEKCHQWKNYAKLLPSA